jgi:integrase
MQCAEKRSPAQTRRDETKKKKKLEIGIDSPTREEVSQLLKSVRGPFRPFLIAAAYTGMRASELRGLRWCDVDFDAQPIHVRQRADRYGEFDAPKSDAGTRSIPVGPFVINTLKQWRNDRKKEVAKFDQKADFDPVFLTQRGTVQKYTNIRKQQPIPFMKEAGVVDEEGKAKYTGLHAFWQFHCSWLLNRKEAGGRGATPAGRAEAYGSYCARIDL